MMREMFNGVNKKIDEESKMFLQAQENSSRAIMAEMDKLVQTTQNVQKEMKAIETEQELVKKQMLTKTLVISGIEDQVHETYEQTEEKVKDLAKKIGLNDLEIDFARRMGRPKEGKHRSIELTLMRRKDKIRLLKAKIKLREVPGAERIYISEAKTQRGIKTYNKLKKFAEDVKGSTLGRNTKLLGVKYWKSRIPECQANTN